MRINKSAWIGTAVSASVLVGATLMIGGPSILARSARVTKRAAHVKRSAPVTLTIWSWRSQDAGMWTKVQAALRKQGVNVTIDYRAVNPTSYDSVLQTAMDGGRGPRPSYCLWKTGESGGRRTRSMRRRN